MRKLCQGDQDAASRIVKEYSPHVLRVVRADLPKAIRSKVDSIDLVNTLLGALLTDQETLATIDRPEQLLALLTKAARRRVIDEHRKFTTCQARDMGAEECSYSEREPLATGSDQIVAGDGRFGGREPTPSYTAISREKVSCVLGTLSSRDRRILALFLEDKSYEQIASEIGEVSARTVRRVLAEITALLQK